jgi:hypothetical protein
MEACALRLQDIDFTSIPTKITTRKEYSKTRRSRTKYISNEATHHLKTFLEQRAIIRSSEGLIFSIRNETKSTKAIYNKLLMYFERLLKKTNMNARKENSRRHKITLHSFRRTVFSIINDQVGSEYANWYLGHDHSVYWTKKEEERRRIYVQKCMPYLTILDYSDLDNRSKNLEVTMKQKDLEIIQLTSRIAAMEQHQRDIDYNQKIIQELLQDPEMLKRKLEES